MIELTIQGLSSEADGKAQVVWLAGPEADLMLPIVVDSAEAAAIYASMGQDIGVPLPHDTVAALLEHFGAIVVEARLSTENGTGLRAELVFEAGAQFTSPARPGDAVAIAQRYGAPILLDEEALQRLGYQVEQRADGLYVAQKRHGADDESSWQPPTQQQIESAVDELLQSDVIEPPPPSAPGPGHDTAPDADEIGQLQAAMDAAAEREDFERAAELRARLAAARRRRGPSWDD